MVVQRRDPRTTRISQKFPVLNFSFFRSRPVGSGPWIPGSEHLLNSMRFWGELHVVCFNDKYAEGHLDQPDGLAVLGFFVDVSRIKKNMSHIL